MGKCQHYDKFSESADVMREFFEDRHNDEADETQSQEFEQWSQISLNSIELTPE